jgi:hypothetical protein
MQAHLEHQASLPRIDDRVETRQRVVTRNADQVQTQRRNGPTPSIGAERQLVNHFRECHA